MEDKKTQDKQMKEKTGFWSDLNWLDGLELGVYIFLAVCFLIWVYQYFFAQ